MSEYAFEQEIAEIIADHAREWPQVEHNSVIADGWSLLAARVVIDRVRAHDRAARHAVKRDDAMTQDRKPH